MAGLTAMFCLYRGLSVGSMAIVAPISAAGVILPVIVGRVTGDTPNLWQKIGMTAAIAGAVLASREKNNGSKGKRLANGVGLAIASAVAAGVYFIVMDRASEADPFWAAFLMRFSYFALLLVIFLLRRPAVRPGRVHLPAIIALGVLDALAGFAFALATTRGMLGLVAVVGALYPAGAFRRKQRLWPFWYFSRIKMLIFGSASFMNRSSIVAGKFLNISF
jgi:drug/metabolite transporter (DMT)-like permease